MNKEYFITITSGYIIHGFSLKKEAKAYLEKNRDIINKSNEDDVGDESTIEILDQKGVEAIALDIFWDQLNGGSGHYTPTWIKKDEDLSKYLS